MWHASVDEDEAVHGADREPGTENRGDHEDARSGVLVDDRADDARERDRGADGKVDPARHDHEQLPEGEDRDHRGLGEDVADVPAREEDRGRQSDDHDQEQQDQRRPGAERPQPGLQQPVAVEARAAGGLHLLLLGHGHHHSSLTGSATSVQPGPWGKANSASDSGSISML